MSFVIRKFNESDIRQIVTLFYETIHSVNIQDYTQEQVEAWAPQLSGTEEQERTRRFTESLLGCISYVADIEGVVIGFADMTENGYLDYLYVHKDYQRHGVASALLDKLEEEATRLGVRQLWANVSITARPFFEHQGFVMIRRQTVNVRGVSMYNFKMEKTF